MLLIRLLTLVTVSVFLVSCSYYYEQTASECDIDEGCLNDILFDEDDRLCNSEDCPMILADLTKKEFDQVIFLRKYQYDLSKTCGDMKINWLERSRFSEHCDYLIFSKGSKMTGFIRGSCFSGSTLSGIENNIYFSDKEDRLMLNRVFEANQKIDLYPDSRSITIDVIYENNPLEFACSTDFTLQAL